MVAKGAAMPQNKILLVVIAIISHAVVFIHVFKFLQQTFEAIGLLS